jgi:hypothetical protein
MTSHQHTDTLDAEHTAAVRAALVDEARRDLGLAPTSLPTPSGNETADVVALPARRGPRRALLGVAAAILLAVGVFAATTFIGGPAGSPAAVAFEPTGDGWTRITLKDVAANPDEVVAELKAKGYDVTTRTISSASDGAITFEGASDSASSGVVVIGNEGQGTDRKVGLAVEAVDSDGTQHSSYTLPDVNAPAIPPTDGSTAIAGDSLEGTGTPPADAKAVVEAAFEKHGIRFDAADPSTIEIRDGSDARIVVLRFEAPTGN